MCYASYCGKAHLHFFPFASDKKIIKNCFYSNTKDASRLVSEIIDLIGCRWIHCLQNHFDLHLLFHLSDMGNDGKVAYISNCHWLYLGLRACSLVVMSCFFIAMLMHIFRFYYKPYYHILWESKSFPCFGLAIRPPLMLGFSAYYLDSLLHVSKACFTMIWWCHSWQAALSSPLHAPFKLLSSMALTNYETN